MGAPPAAPADHPRPGTPPAAPPGERPAPPPPRPDADPGAPPAGSLCGAVLLQLLGSLEEAASAFAAGREVEPLHQLRVSARRLRVALAFFEPLYHGDDALTPARRRIRKLAAPFGDLRDLDVFLQHLDDGVAPVAPSDVARLRRVLVRRRSRLAAEVAARVASGRWRRALRMARDGVATGAWRGSPGAVVDARTFAAERLDLWWWSFLAGSEGLARMAPPARHRVRIEAKRLRYATEVTAGLFAGREMRRAAVTEGLREMQDALGALNDRAVAERMVRQAGFEPVPRPPGDDDLGTALALRAGLVALGTYWETGP